MLDPIGFWSYARLDDEHADGHLSQLRAIVGKAIGLQHGDKVHLWQDIAAIPTGADWAETIERAISQTTFFIPIVTPRFLKSDYCRDEFASFRRRMLALGRNDLIFPVHYVGVDGMGLDEMVFGEHYAALRRSQWTDFQPLFYEDPKSPDVRRWAGKLAASILTALRAPTAAPRKFEPSPPTTHAVPEGPAAPRPPPSARSPGVLSTTEEAALAPKHEFKEGVDFPTMVVVPAGAFTMGSPEKEDGRYPDEGPQRDVRIAKPFAVGKFPVTVDEFKAFVAATGHDAGSAAHVWNGKGWELQNGRSWRDPGFAQTGAHPACCLNWNDAQSYAGWLSGKTGKSYRLLSEAEWEYAARGRTEPGAYPRYFFGDAEADLCRYANGADQTAKAQIPGAENWTVAPCSDGYAYTSPVGSFLPNAFGLYDMAGNVWEWVEDGYHDSYRGAPLDGKAWTEKKGKTRVLRGGSWGNYRRILRAAYRIGDDPGDRFDGVGFRLARTLTP